MQNIKALKDSPLKNVGFHINKGAIPHFKKMEKTMKNQQIPTINKFLRFDILVI